MKKSKNRLLRSSGCKRFSVRERIRLLTFWNWESLHRMTWALRNGVYEPHKLRNALYELEGKQRAEKKRKAADRGMLANLAHKAHLAISGGARKEMKRIRDLNKETQQKINALSKCRNYTMSRKEKIGVLCDTGYKIRDSASNIRVNAKIEKSIIDLNRLFRATQKSR